MRKKLFAILMSAMMMVTFMPSMAFAGVTPVEQPKTVPAASGNAYHAGDFWKTPANYTQSTVLAAVDCGKGAHAGLIMKTCKICGEYIIEEKPAAGCKNSVVEMKPAELKAALADVVTSNLEDKIATMLNNLQGKDSAEKVAKAVDQITEEIVAEILDTRITGDKMDEKAESRFKDYMERVAYKELKDAVDEAMAPFKAELIKAFKTIDTATDFVSDLLNPRKSGRTMAKAVAMVGYIAKQYVDSYISLVQTGVEADLTTQGFLNKTNTNLAATDNACMYLATKCSRCGKISEIRLVRHELESHADCATQVKCKNCEKVVTVNATGTSDYATAITTILGGAKKIAEKVVDGDYYTRKDGKVMEKLDDFTDDVRVIEELILKLDGSAAHEFDVPEVKEVACGKVISLKCKKCGEKITADIPVVNTLVNHNWEEVVLQKAVGCEVAGIKAMKCADCGAYDFTSFKSYKNGHNYAEHVVKATCSMPGYTETCCTVCGKVKSVDFTSIAAPTGHKYQKKMLVAPTCECDGIYEISCENCKKSVLISNDTIINLNGDNADISYYSIKNIGDINQLEDIVSIYKAGGFVDVVGKKYFTGFGHFGFPDLFGNNAIKLPSTTAKNHNYNSWGLASEATCQHGDIWARKCAKCGIDKHAVDAFAKGGYIATEANKGYVVQVGSALDHVCTTYTVAPTCGTPGFSYKVCENCHDVIYTDNNGDEAVLLVTDNIDSMGNYKTSKAFYDAFMKENHDVEANKTTHKLYSVNGYVFDIVDPLVILDAECTWDGEYKTVKKATIFEPGCAYHTCSVCGAVAAPEEAIELHLVDVVIPQLKYGAPGVKAGSKKATVKVLKKNGATKYTIQTRPYGKAYNGQWKNAKTVTKAGNVVIKNLKSGKKYNFRIVATNQYGKKAHSKVTKAVKIK